MELVEAGRDSETRVVVVVERVSEQVVVAVELVWEPDVVAGRVSEPADVDWVWERVAVDAAGVHGHDVVVDSTRMLAQVVVVVVVVAWDLAPVEGVGREGSLYPETSTIGDKGVFLADEGGLTSGYSS